MLKRYVDRNYSVNFNRDIVGVAVIDVDEDSSMDENNLDDPPSHSTSEGPQDVNVSDELGEKEKHEIKKTLLCEYSDVLTDSPVFDATRRL